MRAPYVDLLTNGLRSACSKISEFPLNITTTSDVYGVRICFAKETGDITTLTPHFDISYVMNDATNRTGYLSFNCNSKDITKREQVMCIVPGGIGLYTNNPLTRLSINPTVNEAKITLFDSNSTTNHFGFGVSSANLNYHVDQTSANHSFYATGKNGNGTLLARLSGTGHFQIGSVTTIPTTRLTITPTKFKEKSICTPVVAVLIL
jgi:hypothetical protein